MLRAWEIVKGSIQFVSGFIWGVTDAIIVLCITEHSQENFRRVMVSLKMSLQTRHNLFINFFFCHVFNNRNIGTSVLLSVFITSYNKFIVDGKRLQV